MSILSYKPVFLPPNNNAGIMPQGIVVIPDINPDPTPNVPVEPNGSNCCGVIYNRINDKIVSSESANLLNGIYVSENTNPIPDTLTTMNVLNLKRYSSGTVNNLAITDNKLSLTNEVYIYFWLYVIYTNSFVKPITILTKGSSTSYGEYTIQILPNRTLSFYYTLNGTMNKISSFSQIPERSLTFISIIKKNNSVAIYLNNKPDNTQQLSDRSSPTTNPLLIGNGYNCIPLTGFIDNLMISTYPLDGIGLISKYYEYNPNSILYQFSNGVITYNGYQAISNIQGVQPINIETAKLICTQLENYCQGFSLDRDNNYLYYFTYQYGITNTGGDLYEKVNTLNLANNFFTKLKINTQKTIDISFEEETTIDGYIKGYNGEVLFFIDGILYEYDTANNNYVISPLDDFKAYYVLSSVSHLLAYKKNSFGNYQYFSFIKENNESVSGLNNIVVKKILRYTIGGMNTIVDLSGMSNAGTNHFQSDIQYLSIDNTLLKNIQPDDTRLQKSKDEIVINKSVTRFDTNRNTSQLKAPLSRDLDTDSNIYIYLGQNILPLINKPSNIFVNNFPVLDKTIPFYMEFDKEMDIIQYLIMNNVVLNTQVILISKINTEPGLFNMSIISNSQTTLSIGNRDYQINNTIPEHIVFHNSNNQLCIEIKLCYNKLNQVSKFIIIKP
jgi:hypothetical protein